jgi:hypothetical protein
MCLPAVRTLLKSKDRLSIQASQILGEAYMVDRQEGGALSKIRRYETSLENSFFKILRELERLQAQPRQRQSMSPLAA